MNEARKTFGSFLNFIFNLYTLWVGKRFGKMGKNCHIRPFLNTTYPEHIFLENNVNIGMFCWVATNISLKKEKSPRLSIGRGTSIGAYSMIIAAEEIEIGRNVLMSERVAILDHLHDYQDVRRPIIKQHLVSKGKIIIEDDCFIGINAVILGGVRIGKHTVIGANAVVTKDVPAYSVVVGAPAKIIKQYDFEKKKWIAASKK